MAETRFRIGRRTLVAALAGGFAGRALAAESQPKASKAETQYVDKAPGMMTCSICTFFDRPKTCKVVEGEVGADGWCNLFALLD